MSVNVKSMKPSLSTITGGLSGPAVRPVAVRMVWQVARAVRIPVIGMGGIMGVSDALEFFLAGASAVQVGTASLIEPGTSVSIIDGLNKYLDDKGFTNISDIIGYINRAPI
jgi:dihydroorotate dehydrogenase (NAD+) catalytic subunit